MGGKHRQHARGHTGLRAVGTAGQGNRHPGAEHQPGARGTGQVLQLFGHHVAAFQVGHGQDVSLPRHLGGNPLDAHGVHGDGVVEGQRAVELRRRDLATVGHLAQGRGVQRGGDAGRHGFHGRQDRHLGHGGAQHAREIDGVLDDVGLFLQRGADVDGRVRDQQGLAVQRHIEAEHVRQAAARAQGRLRQHGLEQLVRVQAALHQDFHLLAGGHAGGQFGRGMAVLHGVDFHTVQVDAGQLRRTADAAFGADQHRHDQAVACRVHGTGERSLVTGMDHGAAHRRQRLCARQQVLEAGLRVEQLDLRRMHRGHLDLLRRRHQLGFALEHHLALLVGDQAVHLDALFLVVLFGHRRHHGQGVTDAHRLGELQLLAQVNRAGAGKLGAEQGRNQRRAQHAMRDHAVEHGGVGIFGVQVGGVDVPGHGRKGLDVLQRHGAQQTGALADFELVVGDVFHPFHHRGLGVHGFLRSTGAGAPVQFCKSQKSRGIFSPRRGRRRPHRWSDPSCRRRHPSTGRC